MDQVYSQLTTYTEGEYMTMDPNYSNCWGDYNTGYMDPNQDYYQGQYNMDSYLQYSDDVMDTWDIPSPSTDAENDYQYAVMDNQMASFSSGMDQMSNDPHSSLSPSSSLETGSSENTSLTEDYMLRDKCQKTVRKISKLKGPLRKVHQRQAANVRERRRMRTINNAFEHLRQHVPSASEDKKTSKVDTLKLAVKYITDLTDILKSCGETNFPGLRKRKGNNKVVVNYTIPEYDADTGDVTSGHSLSWTDTREPRLTSDNKMKTRLWIPHIPTREDLKAIEADGGR